MANNHSDNERRLWEAADEFRANSDLKSSQYAVTVLGLIFLRYADHRFAIAEKELAGKGSGRRKIDNSILVSLLKNFSQITMDGEGNHFRAPSSCKPGGRHRAGGWSNVSPSGLRAKNRT